MFTGKKFSLDELSNFCELEVKRNCDFSFVGKVSTILETRLVACQELSHLEMAAQSAGVTGVLISSQYEASVPSGLGYAICESPVRTLNEIQWYLAQPCSGQWASFPSSVHPTAKVMAGAYVAPEDVMIGKDVTIFPNAVILPRSIIGDYSTVGPGTVVGVDAFEVDIASQPQRIISQSGGVRIGKYVDIQAKCTIVRATFGGFTEIGDETKLDCQVHFAHDCQAGRRVRIAACAELSGRVFVGDDAFIGPNASVSNGVKVGENSHITIGAVVTQDVDPGGRVTGNFAISHRKWIDFLRKIR